MREKHTKQQTEGFDWTGFMLFLDLVSNWLKDLVGGFHTWSLFTCNKIFDVLVKLDKQSQSVWRKTVLVQKLLPEPF